jgi:formate/nitrite transporter FocA (FNT family)
MRVRALEPTVAQVSRTLLWAIAAMVVFNIVGTIVVTILVSIARREELKDEAADERDRAVQMRSMRNAYVALSIGAAGSLLLLALGFDPILAAYALFSALMLAGATDSASQLYYYRFG